MANDPIPITQGKKPGMMRGMVSDLQTLLQRGAWARFLGLTFDGKRDLYQTLGYKRIILPIDFYWSYSRGGIAKRIVEAPCNACWSDPPIVKGNARFQKGWDDIVVRQRLFNIFWRLDVLAGLGRFAVLLVGYNDGRKLETPVNPNRQNQILYLQPYAEQDVAITQYDPDPTSPRFGLPVMYSILPGDPTVSNQNRIASAAPALRGKIDVHWSRILHVAEGALDNVFFGHSRLEAVYNYLDDLNKVSGGAAESYWLVANRGMQVDVDKDIDLNEEDADALSDEVDQYQHDLRRVIRTRGVKINNLGQNVTDPRGTYDILMALIASTTGIPQRILSGAEAGQLASDQDRANWANRMEERVSQYASPVMLLPFIEMQVRNGVLPAPSSMGVEWPSAFKLSPLEKAQTSAQMARSAANIIKVMTTPIALDGSGVAETTEMQQQTVPGKEVIDPATGQPQVNPSTGETVKEGDTTITAPVVVQKPSKTLFSIDEARQIVGFGKHPPVFDDAQDADPSKKITTRLNEEGA